MGPRPSRSAISPSFWVLGIVLIVLQYQNCAPTVGPNGFTIGSTSSGSSYTQNILSDGPAYYWKFDETSGSVFQDSSSAGHDPAEASGAVSLGQAPAHSQIGGTAIGLSGNNSYVVTQNVVTSPGAFTLELWFRSTAAGGKLIGFGSNQTGQSTSFDRHLYMSNSGQIYFGIYGGQPESINSPQSLNDGAWHHVAATYSAQTGATLYVDGNAVASAPPLSSIQTYNGYWRIGYDNLTGWPGAPSNGFFSGDLDEIAVYNTALTAQQISTHYATATGAGTGN